MPKAAFGTRFRCLNLVGFEEASAADLLDGRAVDRQTALIAPLSADSMEHVERFSKGPEFIAHAVNDWCRFNGAASLFIDPGSPWQNAWIESFNGRLRDELLNAWRFDSPLEARVIIEDWRCDYNANRPHFAHWQLTPAEFAVQWARTNQPQVA